jgi:hypothetical protein
MGVVMVLLEVLVLAVRGKVLFDSLIEDRAVHLCKTIRKALPPVGFGFPSRRFLILRLWLNLHPLRWGNPCIEHLLEF